MCIRADLLRLNYLASVVIQPSYDNTQGRTGTDKQRADEVKIKVKKIVKTGIMTENSNRIDRIRYKALKHNTT